MIAILLTNYRKYGPTPNSHDIAKFIALLLMLIDHVGFFFFPESLWFRAIGRLSVPIWFFLIGFVQPKVFHYDIVILALLMIIVDAITLNPIFPFNILVSILVCRLLIEYLNHQQFSKENIVFVLLPLFLFVPFTLPFFEYGTQGLLFAFTGYMIKNHPHIRETLFSLFMATVTFLVIQSVSFPFSMLQYTVMISGTITIVIILYHYRLFFLPIEKCYAFKNIMMFTARNSLYFYFFHFVLFECIEWLMHPEKHLIFRWFY